MTADQPRTPDAAAQGQIAPSPEPPRQPQRRHHPEKPQRQQQGQPQRQQQGLPQGQQQGLDLSVVIPLYNEEESLRELHRELRQTLGGMNLRHEILFIDDGSTDRSFQVLRDIRGRDRRVRIIRFRRNYGKSAALSVGFEKAQGAVVITMDADLQDDPAEIPALRRQILEGFDLVSGWKKVRRDPLTKTIPSRFFNFVTRMLTGIPLHDFNCGLKAYRRDVVKTIRVYGELHRYIPVLAHWEGFRVGELAVRHRPRRFGKTKFGLARFWKGLLDLLTALFTTRYMQRPLHLFGFWGMVAFTAGFAIDAWLVVEWFLGLTALSNRPLFLLGIVLMIMGIQFISIGLLGEMITRSRQPGDQYFIRDTIR